MGDLTKNFSRHEFACRCGCGADTVDFILVTMLQTMANHFAAKYDCRISVMITGPNRCYERNLSEGGSDKTQHIPMRAADHKVFKILDGKRQQIEPDIIAMYYETYFPLAGIGRYYNRTHVDSRTNGPARWRA